MKDKHTLRALREGFLGRAIYKIGEIDKRFKLKASDFIDKLQFDHTEGSISLPPGRTSVHLVSTAAQGVDDLRTWNSFFMVSESRQGEQSVYGARMGTYIAGQRKNGEWELIGRFENLLDESPQEPSSIVHPVARIVRTRLVGEKW